MSTFDDMVGFVKSGNLAKDQIVCCLEGPAGIGKTAAINQAAHELEEEGKATGKVITIIASQILPNEVSGITMPVTENKSMEIFDHYRLASLQDGDILFFDELLEADQLVLSACLTLIESRQMMSGKALPNIQIVAATNATIKPNMLKESIRQRFVWRKFNIDIKGCAQYIERTYGLKVDKLAEQIKTTGEEYNILTPRSLTKMAYWMSRAEDEPEAKEIANQIDNVWNNMLGQELFKAWSEMHYDPKEQMRKALCDIVSDIPVGNWVNQDTVRKLFDPAQFDNSTVVDLMKVLQSLDEWPEIEKSLSEIEVVEANVETEVSF